MKIHEMIKDHPTLRPGAFSNSLEEWAEGAMTLEWAENQRVMTVEEMKVHLLYNSDTIVLCVINWEDYLSYVFSHTLSWVLTLSLFS